MGTPVKLSDCRGIVCCWPSLLISKYIWHAGHQRHLLKWQLGSDWLKRVLFASWVFVHMFRLAGWIQRAQFGHTHMDPILWTRWLLPHKHNDHLHSEVFQFARGKKHVYFLPVWIRSLARETLNLFHMATVTVLLLLQCLTTSNEASVA